MKNYVNAFIVCKLKTNNYEWIDVRIPCELSEAHYSLIKEGKIIITMVDNPTIEMADK